MSLINRKKSFKCWINEFIKDASGNPVTQSVVSVTDSSGNPVTGLYWLS